MYKKIKDDELKFVQENAPMYGIKYCSEKLNRPFATIVYMLKKMKIKPKKAGFEYKINLDDFLNITKKEVAYFLGFLWADGSLQSSQSIISLEVVKTDGENLEHILSSLGNFKITTRQRFKNGQKFGNEQMRFRMINKELSSFLLSMDFEEKSFVSPFKILNKIPENLRHYFWRGFLDGDGCIFISNKIKKWGAILNFWGTINQDWSNLMELCEKMNVFYKIKKYERKKANGKIHSSSTFYINRKADLMIFLDYIYKGDKIGLERKRNKYMELINYYQSVLKNKTGSKYLGVYLPKRCKKWAMKIKYNKKVKYLGSFETERAAAEAYNREAIKIHGPNAIINKFNDDRA